VRLHVREWGDPAAPAVVCLHGVQAFGGRFRRLAEERLASRYHVLAPDLRGHARSGREQPWTLAAHVADVLDTVAVQGIWIGHSFGGRVVAELIAAHTDLVEKAVLLDPALAVPPDYAQFLATQEVATDISFASVDEGLDAWRATLQRPPHPAVEAEVREQFVQGEDGRFRVDYSRDAVAAAYLEVAAPPPSWEQMGVPTLIVAGAASKFVSVGEAEVYKQALGDLLEVVVVPGGHSVLWDAFDETGDAIDAFVAD
jgi:lipase